jgi:hypothetical protein
MVRGGAMGKGASLRGGVQRLEEEKGAGKEGCREVGGLDEDSGLGRTGGAEKRAESEWEEAGGKKGPTWKAAPTRGLESPRVPTLCLGVGGLPARS